MAVFSKIPVKEKEVGAIAIGRYAIFVKGFLNASTIAGKLSRLDNKGGIPAHGYLTFKRNKVYYCRFGFVNDDSIYSNEG